MNYDFGFSRPEASILWAPIKPNLWKFAESVDSFLFQLHNI
jgi:hypothetical protein